MCKNTTNSIIYIKSVIIWMLVTELKYLSKFKSTELKYSLSVFCDFNLANFVCNNYSNDL